MSGRHRSLLSVMVAAAVVAIVLWLARERPSNTTASVAAADETVERCLERMLEAARTGDLDAYLDCFDGELRDRLAGEIASRSRAAAAAELQSGEADLKSFATHPLVPPAEGEALVTLERIYARRHDLQRVRLRNRDGEWKIVELVPVDRIAPPIPYGTPVVPEASGANEP